MEVHASGSPQEDRHFLKNNHSESIVTFAHSCFFVSDVAHLTSGPNFCYPRETPNPMGSTVFPESGRNRIIRGRPFGSRLSSLLMTTYERSTLNDR